jgi:cathepsin L
MNAAFRYIISNGGIDTEASYPYSPVAGTCRYNAATKGGSITGFENVAASEAALQNAVATIGPISVAIDASHQSFQLYSSGVYYEPACSSTKTNHAGNFQTLLLADFFKLFFLDSFGCWLWN